MVKTRVILGILAAVLAGTLYAISASSMGDWRYFLYVVCGILLLAAVNVLTFSFMRTEETPSGELCFKRSNLLWRMICKFSDSAEEGRISLCWAYWTVVFAQVLAVYLLVVAAVVVMLVAYIIVQHKALQALAVIGGLAVFFLLWFGGVKGVATISDRMPVGARKKVGKAIGKVGYVFIHAFVLGVLALFTAVLAHNLGTSILVAILYVLGGIAALVMVAFLVRFAFIKIPELRDTPMGKVMGSAKDKLCPTLVSCEYRSESKDSH